MNTTPPTLTELDDDLFFAELELKSLERQRQRLNQLAAWSDAICLRAETLDTQIRALEAYMKELEAAFATD